MELCEPVAIATAATAKSDPCWYCEQPPGPKLKNDETADPETNDGETEDAVPENDEHNDASKLGESLQGQPTWSIQCPSGDGSATVQSAAHHCIPGNASLKKAVDLHDFMREGGPFNLESDIGYGVNHTNNGVWLPGNYGVRKGKGSYSKNWGAFDPAFKDEYAKRTMDTAKVQFHDAHQTYSENVLDALENVAAKLGEPKTNCPICDKPFKSTRPPFGLVGRLDFVSGTHRNLISNLSKDKGRKFAAAGYVTSSRVRKYFGLE